MEKQRIAVIYFECVSVRSLSYPAYKVHAAHCIVIGGLYRVCNLFPRIPETARIRKTVLNVKSLF